MDQQEYIQLKNEASQLRQQLDEANDTLEAIRTGGIDALVVKSGDNHQVYTLKSADLTYRVFIEKMNEGAITLNREGMILYCNGSFAEMLRIPLSKAVGSAFINFVSPHDKASFEGIVSEAWRTESKGEVILVKNDGSLNPFLYSLTTLELDEGTALSMILTDVSLQKETEKQLKQKNTELEAARLLTQQLNNALEDIVLARTKELLLSKEHFKFLADNIPVIAWTALPDGAVTYFNKRWYEYTGMEDSLATTNTWLDIIHPDDKEATMATWKQALKTGEPYVVEYRFKRAADNTYRWHYGNAVAYKDEQGKPVAWFGISADIDEQKKNLERKDEFISTVSHELKTPVTSLKGFTQLLMATLNKESNPQWESYLATMNNQINKLTRLITDLLDATKFSGGQLQFTTELFDFNMLVMEICNEMQLTTDKHIFTITLDTTGYISGDRNRIGQVITNLISNAVKYSPNGGRILISSVHSHNTIQFCVKDFGIGISKTQQPQLYTRFFRATQTEEANTYPGMGLGLFISMGIIEKHKGTMWVNSEVGKGSDFYFTLHTVEAEAAAEQ